jgi:hypothetical protein
VGDEFYAEIWATCLAAADGSGLASVYVDLTFDPRRFHVEELIPGTALSLFKRGAVDPKTGSAFTGGCAAPGVDWGVDSWVRVATLRMRADAAGRTGLEVAPTESVLGVAIFGHGAVDGSRIAADHVELDIRRARDPGGERPAAKP